MPRPLAALAVLAGFAAAAPADTPDPVKLINAQIAAGWKAADIKRPAARGTDAAFQRRAFLDLIGRIPSLEECLDFEADRGPDKRARLVKRLLTADAYTPKVNGRPAPKPGGKPGEHLTFDYANEYAEHWADLWTVWLLSRSAHPVYRQQMSNWLQAEIAAGTSHADMVTKLLTAHGVNNQDADRRKRKVPENQAVNFIALNLGDPVPANRRNELGEFDAVPITGRVTRLFLGVQTQCTQCHDHPDDKDRVMADFWGVNAFFRQLKRSADPTRTGPENRRMDGTVEKLELMDAPTLNRTGVVFYENTRSGKLLASSPRFLRDMAQMERGEPSDKAVPTREANRREALAKFVVGHDNFARAYVNRAWGHFFGRGLHKEPSVDDFSSLNEVVHPQLLDGLADAFKAANYDPKRLHEWICLSDVYSLSHVAPKEAADPKFDPYFARMPLKAMPPEVLFESLQVATRGWFAPEPESSADSKKARKEQWLARLVQNFGDDEGNEMTFNGTITQALQMMNGRELNSEIGMGKDGPVLKVLEKHAKSGAVGVETVMDELFLMTLSRRATSDEKGKLKKLMATGAVLTEPAKGKAKPKPTAVVQPSSAVDWTFYQDVFWALLNTNEFMLNH